MQPEHSPFVGDEYTILDTPSGFIVRTQGHPQNSIPKEQWIQGCVVYRVANNSVYVYLNHHWTRIFGRGAYQRVFHFGLDWE